jgi:hypothetical protein
MTITPGDEYPLHQTGRPVRHAGTSRNLYDRFFFNGYSPDGDTFFAVALGVYPGRNVMDAAFGCIVDGVQHNVRASRLLGDDRLDTRVGPISVRIDEPLRRLTVTVDDDASGVGGELVFTGRTPPIEEAPYLWEADGRTIFDFTRLTQPAVWSGGFSVPGGAPVDVGGWWGTRDRSWGHRPIGERDMGAPAPFRGFYWLWAPLNFDDGCGLFAVNEHPDGTRWHEDGYWVADGSDVVEHRPARYSVDWRSGTRHAAAATVSLGDRTTTLTPVTQFFMQGIGYSHPTWGHAMYVGDDVRTYEAFASAEVDESALMNLHVQAVCRLRRDDGAVGVGILEQLVVGPHAPSGFTDLLDPAP